MPLVVGREGVAGSWWLSVRSLFLVVTVAVGVVFSFGGSVAFADLPEMTISEDTTLTEDFFGVIVIDTDGVTLDCDGHTVEGGWRDDYSGVRLAGTTGVTVKNCVIQEFFDGLTVSWGSGNHIVSNSLYNNDIPMTIAGDSNVVEGNTVAGGVMNGIEVNGASNTIRENHIAGTHDRPNMALENGLSLSGSNNVITNNTVTRMRSNGSLGGHGLVNRGAASGTVVSGNTFSNNEGFGIVDETHWLFNTYESNVCVGNGDGPSSPEWLCDPDRNGPFIDDDRNQFENEIEWLYWKGITRGCNPPTNDRFCPDSNVTRGQMAAFLVRALDLPSAPSAGFVDTVGTTFEEDIDRLAAAGIAKGCNPPDNDRFCPDDKVRREVMAAFLVRALGYTDDGGGDLFVDDDDSIFEADIDKLATAGVTKGCNPPDNDRFCPTENVTRGQMAAFLRRALS